MCKPGCTITFNNVRVKDKNGKIFSVPDFNVAITEDIVDPDEQIDYYTLTTYPEFSLTDEALGKFVSDGLNEKYRKKFSRGITTVQLVLKIDASGRPSVPGAQELNNLTELQRACLQLLQDGPDWLPGTYRNANVPMAIGVWFKVEIK